MFCGCLGSRFFFSDFLGRENKLENKAIFMKNRISSSASGDADCGGIWGIWGGVCEYLGSRASENIARESKMTSRYFQNRQNTVPDVKKYALDA